jgi:hypothetical protein
LATSGHAGMEITAGRSVIRDARIKKTKMFYEQPDYFIAWMIAEIQKYQRKAVKDNFFFSVRLNATSDIDWQNVRISGQTIFEIFPDVQFYDYTKNGHKFKTKAANYHLTYSYTGRNWDICEKLLKQGNNIAMVFNVKNESLLPKTYKGYKVINGDLTDYRIDDAKGIIVGLKWKRIALKEIEKQILKSCFVIQPDDINCSHIDAAMYKEALV